MKNLQAQIQVARGLEEAELVFKGASYVNVFTGVVEQGDIAVFQGKIVGIGQYSGKKEVDLQGKILLPAFIDSHIHLESSLVLPEEFVRGVLPHGTGTVVTDPHEICNVLGTKGLDFMLEATENLPLDVKFLLPSCVPASPIDEAGATLTSEDLVQYYDNPRVLGLAELMDYVSVCQGAKPVLEKILHAKSREKILDGHAPFLSGKALSAYLCAGVGSDHECSTLAEAEEKLKLGMRIMIREGTAAQNLEKLFPLLQGTTASRCLLCTDDKHPNDLLEQGHLDYILRKAVAFGVDPVVAITAATRYPAEYFGLKTKGAVAVGYDADLVVVEDLEGFQVESVYTAGNLVYQGQVKPFPSPKISPELKKLAENTVHFEPVTAEDFVREGACGVLGLLSGEILTSNQGLAEKIDLNQDILKIAVVERHKMTGHIGVGYLKGYGLKTGAIATTIAHDSHNLIIVGTSEEEMAAAANHILEQQGGILFCEGGEVVRRLPLGIGGIMSCESLEQVNAQLESLKALAYEKGVSPEIDPFMSLSFLSLPVIPSLRVTTQGVFSVDTWSYL